MYLRKYVGPKAGPDKYVQRGCKAQQFDVIIKRVHEVYMVECAAVSQNDESLAKNAAQELVNAKTAKQQKNAKSAIQQALDTVKHIRPADPCLVRSLSEPSGIAVPPRFGSHVCSDKQHLEVRE